MRSVQVVRIGSPMGAMAIATACYLYLCRKMFGLRAAQLAMYDIEHAKRVTSHERLYTRLSLNCVTPKKCIFISKQS